MSAFYEWKGEKGAKQPFAIGPAEGDALTLAGLWERWKNPDGGNYIETCSIGVAVLQEALTVIVQR